MDLYEAVMTTKLDGAKTYFSPLTRAVTAPAGTAEPGIRLHRMETT
ncbi:MAG: hypothetical protein V8R75_06005 [Oscillospiraceae bacterium]